MAAGTFLKLAGIDGESTDRDHRNEIDVLSWTWGVTGATPAAGGGGGGAGRATAQPLHFTHRYDKASPMLAKRAAAAQSIASAVLSVRKAGRGQKDFLKITLKDVFVSSVTASGSDGGEVIESVTLSYRSVETAYRPQTKSGALGAEVKFGWDTVSHVVT